MGVGRGGARPGGGGSRVRMILRIAIFGGGLWCGWEAHRLLAQDGCLDAGGRMDGLVCRGAE